MKPNENPDKFVYFVTVKNEFIIWDVSSVYLYMVRTFLTVNVNVVHDGSFLSELCVKSS